MILPPPQSVRDRTSPALTAAGREAAIALLALLLLGAALRLLAILTVGAIAQPHGDERYYLGVARTLLEQGVFRGSFRAPGYPAFLALVQAVPPAGLTVVRIAQGAVSLLAVALVFDVVRGRFGVRAGFVSGLLCAINPTLVHYTHFFWSETLVATQLMLVVWCLDRFAGSARSAWLAAAGLALGVTALTREMVLYFAALVAGWIVADRQRPWLWRALHVAVFVLVTGLVVLPWMVRNNSLVGELTLSTGRWLPIAVGNAPARDGTLLGSSSARQLPGRYHRQGDAVAREAFARRVALESIAAQQPWWIVRKIVRNTYLLFSPASQLARYVKKGWLPASLHAHGRLLVVLEGCFYVLSMSLGILGLWLVPGGRTKRIVVALILFHWAVYVLANASHRYRVPLLPLFALYAGPLVCGRWAVERSFRLRLAGALTCLALFALIVIARARGAPEIADALGSNTGLVSRWSMSDDRARAAG